MIPPHVLERISGSEISGPRVASILMNMAQAIDAAGIPGGAITLDFVREGDPLEVNDLIPQIHLTLKRAQ